MKIRIWHKPSNRWLNPEKTYISALDGAVFEYSTNQNGVFASHYKLWSVSDCVIQLSTGLKDKTGREIYCGDLLQDQDGGISEVYLNDGSYCVRYSQNYQGRILLSDMLRHGDKYIGNIFDNPELMRHES